MPDLKKEVIGKETLDELIKLIIGEIDRLDERINGVDTGGDNSAFVRYDIEQNKTGKEREQARSNIGAISKDDLPVYDGEYVVVPDTDNEQVLKTAQKLLDADIKVNKVPYAEVSNTTGGTTVTIGSEV